MAERMSTELNLVAFLFAVLLFSPESENANITEVITKPVSPSYAVEGQNFSLAWTYTLDGSVGFAKFAVVNDGGELVIWKRLSSDTTNVKQEYQERFKVELADTRAELMILAVQRSDDETYKLNILPTGDGSILEEVILVVNFPPNITEISGNKTATEGGNMTLECLTDGNPTPTITWTRLADKRIVNMPLSDITRQDAGKYKCTADNGIGSPAIEYVWTVVQYPVEAKGLGENATVVQGGKETFSCPVDGIPKPNITWYRGSEVSGTPIFIGEKLEARDTGCYTCVASNSLGSSINITQCLTVESSTASTTPTSAQEGLSQTVIGVVIGVAVFVVIMIGLVTWWVCKEKKCRKNSESGELQYVEVDQRNN